MNETIFVSVASYRDNLCSNTLQSLFENAKYPYNIFVGLCQQNKDGDLDCLTNINQYKSNIRVIKIPYTEAKGPTYARYLCSTLYNGETYFFQIDSHTLFTKDWDIKCINMLKNLQNNTLNSKIIISHYPRDFEDKQNYENNKTQVPLMCESHWINDIISFKGAEIHETNNVLTKHYFIAAGMLFTNGQFLVDVPFDPDLPYLFTGEEILLSARAYTNGYDIYNPSENIIYHYYIRKKENKIWNDVKEYNDKGALSKVKYLLKIKEDGLTDDMKKSALLYGLGNKRTLEQFYKETGININKKTSSFNFCKKNNNFNFQNENENENENENKNKNKKIIYFIIICLIIIFIFIIVKSKLLK
jgi:hypothetical protein